MCDSDYLDIPWFLRRNQEEAKREMRETMIDQMVDHFLNWKLPQDFAPDAGITFNAGHITPTSPLWPTGTNLLTAVQAKEMIRHMLEGALPADHYVTEEEGDAYMHGFFDGVDSKNT